jgi:hypothetical protein
MWFAVSPLPDDKYEVWVKSDAVDFVQTIKDVTDRPLSATVYEVASTLGWSLVTVYNDKSDEELHEPGLYAAAWAEPAARREATLNACELLDIALAALPSASWTAATEQLGMHLAELFTGTASVPTDMLHELVDRAVNGA